MTQDMRPYGPHSWDDRESPLVDAREAKIVVFRRCSDERALPGVGRARKGQRALLTNVEIGRSLERKAIRSGAR